MGDLLLDTGVINKLCDAAFRRACCRCLGACGRPTYPTDPWFEPTVLDEYEVKMVTADGKRLDLEYVEKAIQESAGRVQPWRPWLACTSDTVCCGCVAAKDEARFGFLVVRSASVDPGRGHATLKVWPEHVHKARAVMERERGLVDKFGRPIEVQVIQRAQPVPEDTGGRPPSDDLAAAARIDEGGNPRSSGADDPHVVATEVH
eukprot:CAMPEP_0198657018 /NCGR_PEP_ID=MMETSP1467-20131203/11257_1 /TAXON_ID=1462469 /ORGANISM="unid. sp., Strain CCMP2135" /LENGTH=203 /DNA_ID=CAMNT_0044393107 /DNA_START=49 /DNA_END=660 /DNA_ORIENTATION=-